MKKPQTLILTLKYNKIYQYKRLILVKTPYFFTNLVSNESLLSCSTYAQHKLLTFTVWGLNDILGIKMSLFIGINNTNEL